MRLRCVKPFHTDTGSILGLHCRGRASMGGQSKIASSAHIYNEIARVRPDLIRTLAETNWPFDRYVLLCDVNIPIDVAQLRA